MTVLKCLFSFKNESCKTTVLLLVARVVFSLLLANHGLQKLMAFDAMSTQFPPMLGLNSEVALTLAIFSELVCSVAVIVGFLTRLALIPMIFTMAVAFFVAHGASINEGELAFVYLVVFTLLWIAGAGKCSIDGFIASKCKCNKNCSCSK